jgi:hypothetical protein
MRIAICSPVHGDTRAAFTQCLGRMLVATMSTDFVVNGDRLRPQIELFFNASSLLAESRCLLVEKALQWGADYILWMDADHTFPPDALNRLLAADEAIVGANYPRRNTGEPTAVALDGAPLSFDAHGQVEVATLGLGLCLIDKQVFRTVPKPYFRIEHVAEGVPISEDYYFFRKARASGLHVFVDADLSREVGHIGLHVYTPSALKPAAASDAPPATDGIVTSRLGGRGR